MRWRVIAALVFTGLTVLASHWPTSWQPLLNTYYGEQFYPAIQDILRRLPAPSNFALADALWVALPLALLIRLGWLLRRQKLRRLPMALVIVWLWGSLFCFLLMLMWGLNYQRPSLYQTLLDQGFSRQLNAKNWQFAIAQTNAVVAKLPTDLDLCQPQINLNPDRPGALAHSAMALAELPANPPRRVRESAWSFYYRGIGLAGVYVPFTGEPTYNRFLYPLAKPFTMTHEYMHWAGLAFEYDADIVAYWSLWLAPDPVWQYSAWLAWWRGINAPAALRELLPPAMQQTLQCYQDYQRQQPRWKIADWHWRIYEQNLKAQGVKEGLKSYAMGEALALTSYQDWLLQKQKRFDKPLSP